MYFETDSPEVTKEICDSNHMFLSLLIGITPLRMYQKKEEIRVNNLKMEDKTCYVILALFQEILLYRKYIK